MVERKKRRPRASVFTTSAAHRHCHDAAKAKRLDSGEETLNDFEASQILILLTSNYYHRMWHAVDGLCEVWILCLAALVSCKLPNSHQRCHSHILEFEGLFHASVLSDIASFPPNSANLRALICIHLTSCAFWKLWHIYDSEVYGAMDFESDDGSVGGEYK